MAIKHDPIQGYGFPISARKAHGRIVVMNLEESYNVLRLKPDDALMLAKELLVAALPEGDER